MCTMAINNQFNGIELTFAEKPAEAIREAMKAAGFRWHRQKKLWYAKQSADRLELAKKLSGSEAAPAQVEAPAAAPAAVKNRYGVKVGDIFYGQWGYEQTNVEFYRVTKILSACKVEIVELGLSEVETDSSMSGWVVPDLTNKLGDPVQKMVCQSNWEAQGGSCHIKIDDCITLKPWDGRKLLRTSWY